jgi:hypothetical protein
MLINKTKIMKKIAAILLLFILNSCASLNSLQDGRTLKKGTVEITPMVSLGKFMSNTQNANNIDETECDFLPTLGLRAKYGLTHKIDGGINLDIATNIGFTGKYQFIGNQEKRINTSIGIDFGANITGIINEKLFYYYSVPLYFSYNRNESFSCFVTPRFINNREYVFSNKYDQESVGEKYNLSRIVLSYGFLFGKKNKYGFEINHNSSNILKPTGISFGYSFRI